MMALSWQWMRTDVFGSDGRSGAPHADNWRADALTLRDVVVDRGAVKARLEEYPSLERVWALSVLANDRPGVADGRALLAGSGVPFRSLLVLTHDRRRSHRRHEAVSLQEEALPWAGSPAQESVGRYVGGVRFFDAALYRDAAAELAWAAGRERVTRLCRLGLGRARDALVASEAADEGPIRGGLSGP
jgi:hypothetical protein